MIYPEQDDVYSLDSATLEALQPIHALIFLFKWVGQTPQSKALAQGSDALRGEEVTDPDDYLGVYFANQVRDGECESLRFRLLIARTGDQQLVRDARGTQCGNEYRSSGRSNP